MSARALSVRVMGSYIDRKSFPMLYNRAVKNKRMLVKLIRRVMHFEQCRSALIAMQIIERELFKCLH